MTLCRTGSTLADALRDLSRQRLAPFAGSPDTAVSPAPVPSTYLGVWRRSLLETAGQRDERSHVFWLQTPHWHADLRIPAGRPDFSGVGCLAECDDAQLAWLARQQGFCGVTQVDGDRCTWHRQMDFQPANGSRDIGRMAFDGERVTETGIEADYLEIWERLPPSRGGTAALELAVAAGEPPARPTWLLVAGDCFIYVRGRAQPLPATTDLSHLVAWTQPARSQLLDWLDVEISFGYRKGPNPWRIEHSTLPFREETFLTRPGAIQRLGYQIAVEGSNERRWRILDWSLGAAL
ncbi:MAG: hypothetical protein HY018_03680 [Hydrogenophilales bacterium]|nr:hypothetical protein [Hydrogenophilales bacterium]